MKYDLCIARGQVVLESGVEPLHILVQDGAIAALIPGTEEVPAAVQTVDAEGLHVFPGAIEPHCHFWEPGPDYREGWVTGSQAAAAGGATTVIEMPINNPPTVDREAFLEKKAIAAAKSIVDFALWGGIIPKSGQDLSALVDAMKAEGAAAYKVFMCWSATEYPPVDDGLMFQAMKELARTGQIMGVHAENEMLIRHLEGELKAAKASGPQAFLDSRPPYTEVEAIQRALYLAKVTGVHLHFVHVSTAEGASLILAAKQSGQKITAETGPHYLVLNQESVLRQGPFAKCTPPLRTSENSEQMWSRIQEGAIDFVAADHAPFTVEEKRAADDFWQVPNGIPGIQEKFSLTLSEGAARRGLPLEKIAAITSTNIARTYGLYPQKGTISVGSDADLILVDLQKEWIIRPENLCYRNKWTPYEGIEVQGEIKRTMLRGQTLYLDGEICMAPGFGQFVKPHHEQ